MLLLPLNPTLLYTTFKPNYVITLNRGVIISSGGLQVTGGLTVTTSGAIITSGGLTVSANGLVGVMS
jgi:hypothetical protein